ncbi:ABC transporter permease [Ilumatobacter sp.]|uniref:ABC transporter permease n=1 Tax=Ilumatobacter sp. TaxID=1967498 RepID=UPI003B52C506
MTALEDRPVGEPVDAAAVDAAAADADAAASPWRTALRSVATTAVTFVATTVLLLALWVLFLRIVDVGSYVGKSPADVWGYLFGDERSPGRRSEIWEQTAVTIQQAFVGYVVGTAVATAVAMLFVLSSAVERAVMPIALALRSVPIVAMIPFLAYVFGRDTRGSIVIVSIIVWFPTLVFMTYGLRSLTPQQHDLLTALDASTWQFFLKARFPSALPSFFAAAKVTAPLAILGALINGWLSTGDGLGDFMLRSTTSSDYNGLWSAVVVVTFLSIVLVAVVGAVEGVVVGRFGDGGGRPS